MTADDPSRPAAFDLLLRSPNRAADAALVTCLEQMEPAHQASALFVLLQRDHDDALAAVVARFHTCGRELRDLMIRHADRLSGGMRLCLADERLETRLAAVELIHEGGHVSQADLLADALSRPCRTTAQQAAIALLALTEAALARPARYAPSKFPHPPTGTIRLENALRRSLAAWALHARPELIVAAMRMSAFLEEAILKVARQPRNRIARAFNHEARGSRDPALAGYGLRALRSPHLREGALEMLGHAGDEAFRAALVADAWLLTDDEVRKACVRVRTFACLPEDASVIARHDAASVRAAIRLVTATGHRHRDKVALLERLAMGEEAAAGRAATWALIESAFEGSDEVLAAMAARPQAPLAHIARIELLRRRGERLAPALENTRNVTHAAAPVALTAPPSGDAFDLYWSEFDALAEADRVAIGRATMEASADFGRLLRARCASGEARDRLRSLSIMRALGLVASFAEQVYKAGRDADPVVRSLAVALLGEIDTPTGRRILRAAADDTDPRVQANALEGLLRVGMADMRALLVSKFDSASSRVRAIVVAEQLRRKQRDGVERLLGMLSSATVADRVSGLWVVERLRLTGTMDRLGHMATADPDPGVRRRARDVLVFMADRPVSADGARYTDAADEEMPRLRPWVVPEVT